MYQSSEAKLAEQVERTVDSYNAQVEAFRPILAANPSMKADTKKRLVADYIDLDATRISWTLSLKSRLAGLRTLIFDRTNIASATYRPFFRQHAYFDAGLNHIRGQMPNFFPTPKHPNFGFVVTGVSSHAPFAFVMVDTLPDLHVLDTGQFFGRWRYEDAEKAKDDTPTLFSATREQEVVILGYRRIDNITDDALRLFVAAYGAAITKDDVFFYVYGLMHARDYRDTYAADLKKLLPRIPLVTDPWPFIEAGRVLSEWHLRYETVEPYKLDGLDVVPTGDPYEFFRVRRMAHAKVPRDGKSVADRARIVYNPRVTLAGIPEAAYHYMLGTRSAIDWIIEKYQVSPNKASGIVNDPNDWSREVANPRYILDLLARIVTVSVETMKIVDRLPALDVPHH